MTLKNSPTPEVRGKKRSFAFDKYGNHLYGDRNQAVILAAVFARQLGHTVGVGEDEQKRPVIYIDLPTGQCSWHVQHERIERVLCIFPRYKGQWDGHGRLQRWKRIRRLLAHPLKVRCQTTALRISDFFHTLFSAA